MNESENRIKYYCELYQKLINNCLNTNKEVFGKELPEFCIKYTEPYNNLCK
jgi:hypothetical protein|tara:strand:- start:490 stop:642 length:153 start_codon:yes stop_codon:yes gene_type:complete